MAPIKAHIAKVSRLFPGRSLDVTRLALRNDDFRSMCTDYGMALDTLDVLERRNHPMDVEKMVEYRMLIKELEHDLESELFSSVVDDGGIGH